MSKKIIYSKGDVINGIELIMNLGKRAAGRDWGIFKCACGSEFECEIARAKIGKTKVCLSCSREKVSTGRIIHGHAKKRNGQKPTREYNIWRAMKDRCTNKSYGQYENYGGRGIYFIQEWNDFNVFLKDMGHCPKGYSIERVDNEKGYSKDNCIWATKSQQANNKRNNVFLEYMGQKLTAAQWEKKLKFPSGLISQRLGLKWSIKKTIETRPLVKGIKRGQSRNSSIAHVFGFLT